MPFAPWTEQKALPPNAPEQAPKPRGKNWWEQGVQRWQDTGGFTMPWQQQHWANQPDWTRNVGKAGLGIGLAAGGLAGGLGVAGGLGALGAAGSVPWWISYPALAAGESTKLLGAAGGLTGLIGSANIAPSDVGVPPTPEEAAANLQQIQAGLPANQPGAPQQPGLPAPGALPGPEGLAGPEQQPQIIDVGGQKFWWNPGGGIYGTGGWEIMTQGLSPEQILSETAAERRQESELAFAQGNRERQQLDQQAALQRQAQEAQAAQAQANIYANDPYKYWAQQGLGTPEAVARLTGGQVAPGEQFQQGVPLSQPSQQWWGNLLPSEQQQIMGGVNWLGIDPNDWMAMQQRMIPGLAQRQPGAQWAR